jgi:predicted transcriptional regulator
MENKSKLNPTDRDIIRSIRGNKLGVTPSKIAKTINIHPVTAQKHVQKLSKLGYLKCDTKGNRTYCKVNRDRLKKGLD